MGWSLAQWRDGEELRAEHGERVVLFSDPRPRKESGLDLETTVLDLTSGEKHRFTEHIPERRIVVARPGFSRNIEEIREWCAQIGVGLDEYPHGLVARCFTQDQVNALPPDVFIVTRGRVNSPRTKALPDDQEYAAVSAALENQGFSFVPTYTPAGQEFRVVVRERWRRLEMSPMTEKEFHAFYALTQADPVLRTAFQFHRYESAKQYPSKPYRKPDGTLGDRGYDDAFAYMLELIERHQQDRWFYYDLYVEPIQRGVGRFKKDAFVIRATTIEPEPQELIAEGFLARGLYTNKSRQDVSQQDEQRHWHEMRWPPGMKLNGSTLTVPEIQRLTDILRERYVAAFDIETRNWHEDPLAPRPNGEVFQMVISSASKRIIIGARERMPQVTEIGGYTLRSVNDPIELCRVASEELAPFLFLGGHNSTWFDHPALRIYNAAISPTEVFKQIENHRRNVPPEVRADKARMEAHATIIQERAARVNELRKGVKGRVWIPPRTIDTSDYFKKRRRFFGGENLEAVTGEFKEQSYEEQRAHERDRTEEGNLQDAIYAAGDGEKGRKALERVLPIAVAEMVATNRALNLVAASRPSHNMLATIKRDLLRRGSMYHGHLYGRQAVQRAEDMMNEAVASFSTLPLVPRKTGYFRNALVWYHPLILHSQRALYRTRPGILAMAASAQQSEDPLRRLFAFSAAEYLLAAPLSYLARVLRREDPDRALSLARHFTQEAFEASMLALTKRSDLPDGFLGVELRLPRGFSLYGMWRNMRQAARGVQEYYRQGLRTSLSAPFTQAGPYFLGTPPPALRRYVLGTADVAVLPQGRVLMAFRTPEGPELGCYRLSIPKKDNRIRPELLAALTSRTPITYAPLTNPVQRLKADIENLLYPAALTE